MAKRILYEVSYIRPLVIFLLVVTHSFAIYSGAWPSVNDVDIPIYREMVRLIIGFRIETIALIAGYVFAFQSIDLNRKYRFVDFIKKKFIRLIVPCWFYGVIYYFLFYYSSGTFLWLDFFEQIVDGVGHLWFLPMLFWCFLGMWWIDNNQLNEKIVFVLLGLLSILPIPSLPLGLTRVFHFLFYFYIGYLLWEYKTHIKVFVRFRYICVFAVLYIVLLFIESYFDNSFIETLRSGFYWQKLILILIDNFFKMLVTLSGVVCLYTLVIYLLDNKNMQTPSWVLWCSSVCYGVYVYHQFILDFLYYKTSFAQLVNPYILPWVALLITLLVSIVLTICTLKTKIGRYLIG